MGFHTELTDSFYKSIAGGGLIICDRASCGLK